MTKRVILAIVVTAITLPLQADFSSIAKAIDRHSGVKRVWIPFLGIARAAVRVIRPEGVHDFQLATFEGSGNLDPRALHGILEEQVGPGFTPLVRVWSKKSGEFSFIYAKPAKWGSRMELMILTHDDEQTVLVRVDVDAAVVARELGEPRKVVRVAGR